MVACDLFAGAGGFSLGAYLAGVRVAAAIESNHHACNTYRSNLVDTGLTDTKLFEKDIRALSPFVFRRESGLNKLDCDILLGGPPCQGFSTHRLNDSGVIDPRNELLLRYFEYVRIIRPRLFLVENVPGMLWARHKSYVERFYRLARDSMYDVFEPVVLNARDFGVPQNRRRVFILGRDQLGGPRPMLWPPPATHGAPNSKGTLPPWEPASVAFEKPTRPNDPNDVHMNHCKELVDAFARTPPNGGSRCQSGRVLPCHKKHNGHHDVYGRIDPSVSAPTMTTACINPSKGRFVHPTEHHGLTLRQAARIQSFPDWYNFDGGLMAGGVQVGNAVPVDLAEALLGSLKQHILALRDTEEVSTAA